MSLSILGLLATLSLPAHAGGHRDVCPDSPAVLTGATYGEDGTMEVAFHVMSDGNGAFLDSPLRVVPIKLTVTTDEYTLIVKASDGFTHVGEVTNHGQLQWVVGNLGSLQPKLVHLFLIPNSGSGQIGEIPSWDLGRRTYYGPCFTDINGDGVWHLSLTVTSGWESIMIPATD